MKRKYLTSNLPIVAICLLGFLLRSYNYNIVFNFSPELGDNLLEIKNYVLAGTIPLVGPPTSHPWLSFGPYYYWILTPLLMLFKWNPLVAGYFGVTTGSVLILINYIFVKKIFSKKIALISSGLMAVSPLWLSYSRDARFYFLVTLFFYPFYYFLTKYQEGNPKALVGLIFFWGTMLSFHLSPLIFIPVILYAVIRSKENVLSILKALFVFFITQLPFLIYDAKNGFDMTKKLILWLPYRLAGFFYLYSKNNPTFESLTQSLKAILELTGKTFIFNERFWPLMALASFLLFVKNSRSKDCLLLTGFMFLSFLAVLIHGDSPTHYLLPVFPVILIMISIYLSKLGRKVVVIIFLLLFLLNINSLVEKKNNDVNFQLQNNIADAIITDAKGAKYMLKRVGPYDYFKGDFAQNYQYFLWWKGNEPLPDSPLVYTIYEVSGSAGSGESVIYTRNGIMVTRKGALK